MIWVPAGYFLTDVLVICALVMILDVEEIGEQAVGNHVVLVGCAPALLEIGGHVRPGESHVAVGRLEIVFHEPVDTLDVGLEHPAQIPGSPENRTPSPPRKGGVKRTGVGLCRVVVAASIVASDQFGAHR